MLRLVGHSSNAIGIANSTIVVCLLDHLINAGQLTKLEARGILTRASDELRPHRGVAAVGEALTIISNVSERLEQDTLDME
jgi:hypothetical protein